MIRSHFELVFKTMELQQMARIHDRVVADAMFAEDAQDPWEQEASDDVQEGPAATSDANAVPFGNLTPAAPPPPLSR